MGGWWRWALVGSDGVASRRMVSVSASVNLPLHHKVRKFSSRTGSPGWSQKNGRKMVVVWRGGESLLWYVQAVRNESDLKAMAVPPKYQKMNTFYKYETAADYCSVLCCDVTADICTCPFVEQVVCDWHLAAGVLVLSLHIKCSKVSVHLSTTPRPAQ